jgi:hypothetical protein
MKSHCCLRVCMCSPRNVGRQGHGKHVLTVTNAQAKIEESLDASLCMRSVSLH